MDQSQFICPKHKKNVYYLHYRKNKTGQVLKCPECGIEDQFDWNDIMSLPQVLESNVLQINLTSFQIGEEWEKSLSHFLNPNCSDTEIQLISTFYDDFEKEVIKKIQSKKKAALQKAESLQKLYETVVQKCKEVTSQPKLLEILKNHQTNSSQLNEELTSFFQSSKNSQKDNLQDIKEAIENFESFYSTYDPQRPEELGRSIKIDLDLLTFFPEELHIVKTLEDIQQELPIFLANKTSYLSQVLKNTASFFESKPLNPVSFNACKIGKLVPIIEADIEQLYLQKQRELQESNSSNYLATQVFQDLKSAPLKFKFNCLANLINTLPILSAIDILKQQPQQVKYEMVKQNLQLSNQYVIVAKNQQGFFEISTSATAGWVSAQTNFNLIPDNNYLIQFKILNTSTSNYQSVGICPNNIKNESACLNSSKLSYYALGVQGLNKKIKGQDLYLEMKGKTEYTLEMQICIQNRKIICYDLPDKKSICQIPEENIDPKGEYCFGGELFYQNDKIVIQSFEVVDTFLEF